MPTPPAASAALPRLPTPWRRALVAALLALGVVPLAATAAAEDDLLPIDEAFALQAEATARDRVAFRFAIAEGYYLYRHRFGVKAVDGFDAGTLHIPDGEARHDEFFGDVETYRGAVALVQDGRAADGAREAVFDVSYQGCADIGVCYPPHRQRVTVALPAADTDTATAPAGAAPAVLPLLSGTAKPAPIIGMPGPVVEAAGTDALPLPPEEAFGFEAIASSPSALLLRFTPAPGYYLYRDRSAFRVLDGDGVALGEPRWPEGVTHEDEHFGEVIVYFDQVELPLPVLRSTRPAQRIELEATFQGCQDDGICYPPMTRRVGIDLPEAGRGDLATTAPPALGLAGAGTGSTGAAATVAGGTGLLLALLLALGGGLVLNLMPCVLPVLSLKAIGLADTAGDRAAGHRHALWYTAGVMTSFALVGALVLGLREAGAALGWGFQLQQPLVIALLVYVMLAIGLALSGVFHIGAGLAGFGDALTRRGGPAGDFFTGVLAVVVASPCTAPFMGTALAYAFTASAPAAMLVFLALGLGLALPFLLIGFVPALARLLPRPGAWMETFKQFMAFPMYLTAVWLVWVLARQRGADAVALVLIGATLLAMTLWWRERARGGGWVSRLAIPVLLALALLPLAGISVLERPQAQAALDGAVRFSPDALTRLRADGRTVFVNMTADWCITCKANERAVLGGEGFRAALAEYDAVYVKGDWTDVDPEISAFLESHGAVGVPFYIVYPRDGGEGRILPTVLTLDGVREALATASGPSEPS